MRELINMLFWRKRKCVRCSDYQIIDTVEGTVSVDTYKDGVLIQHTAFPGETALTPYFLWNGPGPILNVDFNVSFSIYDRDKGGGLLAWWRRRKAA
jgi:hypothetical protein